MIIKICPHCKKEFIAEQMSRKYCSRDCYNKSQIGSVGYWRNHPRLQETKDKIAKTLTGRERILTESGRKIMIKKLSKSNNWNWKGGKTITKEGYVRIKRYRHPLADSNHYIFEHRIVMENFLRKNFPNSSNLITKNGKKFLNPKIDVHHIDKNKKNNKIDNLECVFRNKHIKIHDPLYYRWKKKTIFVN